MKDAENIDLHKEAIDERLQMKANKEKYIKNIRNPKKSRVMK